MGMAWYQLDIPGILFRLDTSEHGLDDSQAKELFHRHGPNLIAEPEKISKIKLFFHQLAPIVIVVLITLAICLASKWYYEDWFANPYKYVAKTISLSATILMCCCIILSTRWRFLERYLPWRE
jgi:magnesium-transporting ATPase (P-type)